MAIWKKATAKSGGTKKSSSGAKKRATEKKASATKKAPAAKPAAKASSKATAKANAKTALAAKSASAPKPAAPAKAAAKEKPTPAPTQTTPRPAAKTTKAKPGRAVVVKAGTPDASKLGTKWSCFRCSAKFYDLNKPEPLCPKCGADQRQRPKVAPPPPAPEKRKPPRPMAPLLEDEDDGSVRYEEDIDLGVRAELDEPDDEIFQPGEFEDEDVFGGPDEE